MKFISKAQNIKNYIKEQVLFSSFDGNQRTDLSGEHAEDKTELFNVIHSYYREDLLNILHSFTEINASKKVLPIVDKLYEEGLIIRYLANTVSEEKIPLDTVLFMQQHKESQTVFVPFRIKSVPSEERFYYLCHEAEIRQGILAALPERFYFTVVETKKISKNMLRIFIASDVEIPKDSAGFAYRFILNKLDKKTKVLNSLPFKTLAKIQTQIASYPTLSENVEVVKKQAAIIAFEVLKRLPKELEKEGNEKEPSGTESQNQKVDKKAGRYYTLRQLKKPSYDKQSNTKQFYNEVDIYLHGKTAGGRWATSLKKGDIIYATHEYEETIQNMTIGQALLICDETSMPSVAAVLEQWQSPVTPIVISITNELDDFNYFDECAVAEHIKDELKIIHIVSKNQKDIAPMVIEHIQKIDKQIDCAWGAIGTVPVKPIKKYLSETYHLKGKLNRIRAYWN